MSEFVADFHIHSRYSRATSKYLTIGELAKWAKLKGIGVLGTGDFTHPMWLMELQDALRERGDGLYEHDGAVFMLTVEVNTLFYRAGRAHQIHQLIFAPSLEAVERINRELAGFGDLGSDGRPILRIEPRLLVEVTRGIEPRCIIVPAHVWTPHFSVFGSNSGFDTLEECFQDQTRHITALETGLSSDPAMNGRLSSLDRYTLISNSDAHSARRIGREANLFQTEMTFEGIADALRVRDPEKLVSTVEFFPEEGKYHVDGHRQCRVRWMPEETRAHKGLCSECGRPVTVGVLNRVEALADRSAGRIPPKAAPFTRMVPLDEIIAEALGVSVGTQTVEKEYHNLVYRGDGEFNVLLRVPEEALRRMSTSRIVEGILRVRKGELRIEPGYDGEYGTVKIFEGEAFASAGGEEQMSLF